MSFSLPCLSFFRPFFLSLSEVRCQLVDQLKVLDLQLEQKSQQLQDLTEEKGTLAGEIRDMKDMLEVKERKINVLQKKVRARGTYLNMIQTSH